jgi:hypothetical protein
MYDPGQEDDGTLLLHTISDPNAYGFSGPPDFVVRAQLYRQDLQNELGANAGQVELLCTEFNSVSSTPVSNQTTSLVNGLFVADAIGTALQTEYNSALQWDLRNTDYETDAYNPNLYGWRVGGDYGMLGAKDGWAPESGPYIAYPTYYAEQLVSKMAHAGGTVVHAASDNIYLSAYAVREQTGHLALLVINKSPWNDDWATFNVSGYTPSGQGTLWQYGKDQDNAQRDSGDGSSSLYQAGVNVQVNGGSFNFDFPAYSMSVLDLSPAGAGPGLAGVFQGLDAGHKSDALPPADGLAAAPARAADAAVLAVALAESGDATGAPPVGPGGAVASVARPVVARDSGPVGALALRLADGLSDSGLNQV